MGLLLLVLPLVLILVLRPVRSLFVAHATFTVPALAGAFIGLLVGTWMCANAPNVPAWIVPLHALVGAAVVGEEGHRWLQKLK